MRPGILELLRPRLFETRNFGVVDTETSGEWAKVVETESFSRVSLYSALKQGRHSSYWEMFASSDLLSGNSNQSQEKWPLVPQTKFRLSTVPKKNLK